MKKAKSTRLIAAITMLVVSAVALTSASFAWFTMQKEVTASGLSLTATAPTSLLISKTGADASDFATSVTFNAVTLKMVPVSGDYKTPTLFYAEKNTQDGAITDFTKSTFVAVPGVADTARQYYIDIPLWIKSSNDLDANTAIDLSVKSLAITNTTKSLNGAFRVSVLEKELMYASDLAIKTWTPLATATSLAADTVSTVATGTINTITNQTAVPVTLRVWLEGQDTACTLANAGGQVTVAITFEGTDVIK